MKRLFFLFAICMVCTLTGIAQKSTKTTHDASWLKVGIEGAFPVGDISKTSTFAVGGVVAGQWMLNPHFGLGVASGYTHYFAQNSNDGFGTIPLGALLRYYPHAAGFFAGADVGYSFLTDVDGKIGGFYVKPELGYHNYHWNFYGFFNHVAPDDGFPNLQTVGAGVIYNLGRK